MWSTVQNSGPSITAGSNYETQMSAALTLLRNIVSAAVHTWRSRRSAYDLLNVDIVELRTLAWTWLATQRQWLGTTCCVMVEVTRILAGRSRICVRVSCVGRHVFSCQYLGSRLSGKIRLWIDLLLLGVEWDIKLYSFIRLPDMSQRTSILLLCFLFLPDFWPPNSPSSPSLKVYQRLSRRF